MKNLGRRIYQGIQRHLTLLKGLFILSVLVFVIFEVGRIFRDLNGEQLRASLTTQSPVTLLAMLVIGFFSDITNAQLRLCHCGVVTRRVFVLV